MFVMHGPDGKDYPNESVFEEIEAPAKIVIRHASGPQYRLTVRLTPSSGSTIVSWSQAFDHPDVARRIEHIVLPANEQNLDRLTAAVLQ